MPSCDILLTRGEISTLKGVILMKIEEGTIVSILEDGTAEVKVGRHSDCIACGACDGASDIVVTALNPVNAQEGQHVKGWPASSSVTAHCRKNRIRSLVSLKLLKRKQLSKNCGQLKKTAEDKKSS